MRPDRGQRQSGRPHPAGPLLRSARSAHDAGHPEAHAVRALRRAVPFLVLFLFSFVPPAAGAGQRYAVDRKQPYGAAEKRGGQQGERVEVLLPAQQPPVQTGVRAVTTADGRAHLLARPHPVALAYGGP
ncbi:hypothetical protein [Streptomyces smyrnaeus]|uniref:hypothetical protein n=1 Tax=Streptomyces smyrnaeus TaxID=1387713 RepID=UPI0036BBF4E1